MPPRRNRNQGAALLTSIPAKVTFVMDKLYVNIFAIEGKEPPLIEFLNTALSVSREPNGELREEDPTASTNKDRTVIKKEVSEDKSLHTFIYYSENQTRLIVRVSYKKPGANAEAELPKLEHDEKPTVFFNVTKDSVAINAAIVRLTSVYSSEELQSHQIEIASTEITIETDILILKIGGIG